MLAWRHMKASTRLWVLISAVALAPACGGDDTLDPAKLAGEWSSGGEVLILDPTNAAGGYVILDEGKAGALAISDQTITIGDEIFAATYSGGSSESLMLSPPGRGATTYVRVTPEHLDAIDLPVLVDLDASAPALVEPHVALLALLRSNDGQPFRFFVIPADVEPGIDKVVDPASGAPIMLSRTEGALGVERIAFGTTGFVAVNVVVAYEDRDHDGKLTRTVIDDCAAADADCIRGVGDLFLAARDGDSAELQAAGFGLMREGWAESVVVPDSRRPGGTTILPTEARNLRSVRVTFAADPTTAKFPDLKF
jgi:hypothetical protein